MADEVPDDPNPPEDNSGGNFLTNKMGPLPMWGWIAVVIGTVVLYKIIKGRSSSGTGGTVAAGNNAASLFGSSGFSTNSAGQLVDNATGDILGQSPLGTGGTSGGTATGSAAAAWFTSAQQTLFGLGYDSNAVDQALQDYAAGNSLPSNEYGIVEAAIKLVGQPPTGVGLPSEMQPPAPPTPPSAPASPPVAPALPSWLQSAMTSNGEYIVSTAMDNATGQWLYLTQKGGVYGGGYGSIFSLRPGTFAGRTAQSITALPNGGYTVTDTAGETYTFSPTPGSNYANAGPGNNYTPA
jgi:hypothetical protein